MTTIVNLFGGPGIGKSTASANLYAHLKQKHYSVELVTEYCKMWAYANKPIGTYDQLYVEAKQMYKESQLLGKVDYLVTDSPVYLCAFYAKTYYPPVIKKATIEVARAYAEQLKEDGHKQLNFFLKRRDDVPFSESGRFHDQKQSIEIDRLLKEFLIEENVHIAEITAENLLEIV